MIMEKLVFLRCKEGSSYEENSKAFMKGPFTHLWFLKSLEKYKDWTRTFFKEITNNAIMIEQSGKSVVFCSFHGFSVKMKDVMNEQNCGRYLLAIGKQDSDWLFAFGHNFKKWLV